MEQIERTHTANVGTRYNDKQEGHYTKYPPYGKALADRRLFNNKPSLVIVCVGGKSWERAKNWQQTTAFSALVLTPDLKPSVLHWPVNGCPCLVEWDIAAPESLIIELVKILLRSGALSVTVAPLWIDVSTPSLVFDATTQTWETIRESIKTYYPRAEVGNVA